MTKLISIGILLVLIGFILTFIGSLNSKVKSDVAFGGFIGPIPFGFASNPTMFWILISIIIIMLLIKTRF